MSAEADIDLVGRLRFVLANMHEVVETFGHVPPPEINVVRIRIARWIQSLESIIAQGEQGLPKPNRALLEAALMGENVTGDAAVLSLHDLTQLAAVLGPVATLTVLNGHHLSPIEQASIVTTKPGQVWF